MKWYFFVFLSPVSTLAGNLRGKRQQHSLDLKNQERRDEHHARRMQELEIAKYWTPAQVHNAIPLDVHVPKSFSATDGASAANGNNVRHLQEPSQQQQQRQRKVVVEHYRGEDSAQPVTLPHRLDDPNRFLILSSLMMGNAPPSSSSATLSDRHGATGTNNDNDSARHLETTASSSMLEVAIHYEPFPPYLKAWYNSTLSEEGDVEQEHIFSDNKDNNKSNSSSTTINGTATDDDDDLDLTSSNSTNSTLDNDSVLLLNSTESNSTNNSTYDETFDGIMNNNDNDSNKPPEVQINTKYRAVDQHISPFDGAVLTSSYVDFVVDLFDPEEQLSEKAQIVLYLYDYYFPGVSKTVFRPVDQEGGNGRYIFTMGPLADGYYGWAIQILKRREKAGEGGSTSTMYKEYDHFYVATTSNPMPPYVEVAPTTTTSADTLPTTAETSMDPTSPQTIPISAGVLPTTSMDATTTQTVPTSTGELPMTSIDPTSSTQTMPTSTGFFPTTTQVPPTTTIKPTTTKPTQNLPPSGGGNGGYEFIYYSPSSTGTTTNPVNFEWKVTGPGITKILLYMEYPDGTQGYLTRDPTKSGYDSVSFPVQEDNGDFYWSLWVQVKGGGFKEGPWQTFRFPDTGKKDDPTCMEKLGRYTKREQDLHKAVGRIMFVFNGQNYLCTGTLVEGANDRAVIATAAHCVYDRKKGGFPDYVMFIPGQDDGQGDASDLDCSNDPHGCFYPIMGVTSDEYQKSSFSSSFQYDYGFYVAPDTDPGAKNGPDKGTFAGNNYKSLTPMGITFGGMKYGDNDTYLFGYPGARDPEFMYTQGRSETSPITNGGWYVDCSGLTGGASGGPWTQSDPKTGRMVLASVNSWGWTDGGTGMGSPPYDTGGAECVYNAALSSTLKNGNNIFAPCPK